MAQPTHWKRNISLALGAAGVVHGLRRGGVRGLLEIAASVWAVKKGLSELRVDSPALSQARPLRGIPAERTQEEELGIPGGAYNVRPTSVGVPSADTPRT